MEVRESFHSDAKYDFTYVEECNKMIEMEKFDVIAATWLRFENHILSSTDDTELIVNKSFWDELVALKTLYVNKTVHKHKMIAANLDALSSILVMRGYGCRQLIAPPSTRQRFDQSHSGLKNCAKNGVNNGTVPLWFALIVIAVGMLLGAALGRLTTIQRNKGCSCLL